MHEVNGGGAGSNFWIVISALYKEESAPDYFI